MLLTLIYTVSVTVQAKPLTSPMEIKVSVQVNSSTASLSSPMIFLAYLLSSVFPPESGLRSHIRPRVFITIWIGQRENVKVEVIHVSSNLRVNIVLGNELFNEIEGSVRRGPFSCMDSSINPNNSLVCGFDGRTNLKM